MSEQTDTLLTADYADTAEATEAARIAADPETTGAHGGLLAAPDRAGRARGLLAWFQEASVASLGRTSSPSRCLLAPNRRGVSPRSARSRWISYTPTTAHRRRHPRAAGGPFGRQPRKTAGKMVFANGTLLDRRVHTDDPTTQGVIWKPLEAAMAEHADLFRQHFMAQETVLGSAKFAALHRAHVRTGTFLYVPKNVEIALPLETFHWLDG